MTNAANFALKNNIALIQSYALNSLDRPGSNFVNRVFQTYYIEVLELVRLVTPIHDGDRVLPAGSVGTVVYKYVGAYDYEVEFSQPFHSVIFVEGRHIALVSN